MATNTTNLQLVKPAPEDFYDIAVHNGNMDIIDTEIQELKERPSGGVQTTGDTMTGKLDIEKNGEALALKGTNTSFIGLYPRGTEREGYIGFGESTNKNIFITNQNEDGNIIFRFNNGDEIDTKTLDDIARGLFKESVYITSNSDSIASVGIGGSNSTNIHFNGDDLYMIGEIDLDRTTKVLSIKNLFDDGEIVFHDKDGDVKLADLVKYKDGKVTLAGDAGILKLEGATHAYMEIYRNVTSDQVRGGFIGFPNQDSLDLVIENELPTGKLILKASGDAVYIDDYPIPKIRVSTSAPSGASYDIWHQYV